MNENSESDSKLMLQEPSKSDREKYETAISELKAKGTFAGCIEYGMEGEFLGMVYEKDLSFATEIDQKHFAKSVEWWKS